MAGEVEMRRGQTIETIFVVRYSYIYKIYEAETRLR